jgi:hypothetical protein
MGVNGLQAVIAALIDVNDVIAKWHAAFYHNDVFGGRPAGQYFSPARRQSRSCSHPFGRKGELNSLALPGASPFALGGRR